jgi:sec-independent protein translocase protein TatA
MANHLPHTLAFINNIGPMEWIIILVVMLLLFGRRLPEVGKSLGKGIVEFKKGLSGVEEDVNRAGQSPAQPAAPAAPWMQQNQQLPPSQMAPNPVAQSQPNTVSREGH